MSNSNHLQLTAAIGLVGLLSAVGLVLSGATGDLSHAWTGAVGFIALAGIGAMAAGYVCAGLFGRGGAWGWWLAGCGAVSSTTLGASLAGTLFAPVYGTVLAPLVILASLVYFPLVGFAWVLGMGAIHLFALKLKG